MKRKASRDSIVLVVMVAIILSVCAPGSFARAAKKASIKQKKLTVVVGKTKKIKVVHKNKKRKYVFSTNRNKIATVSKSGVVRGKKAGKAVITVKETFKQKKKNKTRVVGKVTVNVKKNTNTKPVQKGTQPPAPSTVPSASGEPGGSPASSVPEPTTEPSGNKPSFYVSEKGSDSADGSQSQPFKTLSRAKEAVRNLDKKNGDIVVEIADGFYPVEEPVVFTREDSGTDGCTITYRAAEGAKPVFSGGKKIEAKWQAAEEVDWLEDGRIAYKTPLERSEKLRAIYVNGERASMTSRSQKPLRPVGSYQVSKGEADWAWAPSTTKIYTGAVFAASFG